MRVPWIGRTCGLGLGSCCRALRPEFVGHGLLDGVDQGVELLLRQRLRARRWRLRKSTADQPQYQDDNHDR
jgi:hypothetical protein